MKPDLTVDSLKSEAASFSAHENQHSEASIYGVTDGKAIGTYVEHKFRSFLKEGYSFVEGSSASGIDFPSIGVDMKVTRTSQPQSSSPFHNAREKIFGLGYHLLVFVYEKSDDDHLQVGHLEFRHVIFVDRDTTADYQTTLGILEILERNGNKDDLVAYMFDRNLPVDDIGAQIIADEILITPPKQGYLTISNALQWRLQYRRVIDQADITCGLERLI